MAKRTKAKTPHKRTGLRTPKDHLKTWDDGSWTRRLTPRLQVGMVDEDLPFGKEGGRKSWYLSLTGKPDLFKTLGPVDGAPKTGTTLLLFEDDVIALVQHLMETELVVVDETSGNMINGPAKIWQWARMRQHRAATRRHQRRAAKGGKKS